MTAARIIAAGSGGAWRAWARAAGASSAFGLSVSFALVVLIGIADYLTGYEIRLAILYLVPIAWSTWRLGGTAGAAVALAASVCWVVTFSSSHPYANPAYFYLEGGGTGATFLIIVALLARLHGALERSDARLITVLEGLDAAVHVEDAETGVRLYDNRRFRDLFGARRFSEQAGEIHDSETRSWYLLQSRPVRWTDGRPAVLRMLSDITKERQAREVLARHRDALHKTSRLVALGEFAAAIAHELNQPLAAVTTYNNACLRLLESKDYDPRQLEGAMRKCRDQARRAGAIIRRLREVLRHPVPAQARLDLQEVAETVQQLAAPDAADAGVTLELARGPRLPSVRTDRLLVEQVALNLVRNAIEAVQHLPPERRSVRLSISAGDGRLRFAVRDTGDGVPPEVQGRLFEAFVTTKPGGLGLGLSICRSVIESLGGSIAHRAPEGGGAEFSFSLPVADQ